MTNSECLIWKVVCEHGLVSIIDSDGVEEEHEEHQNEKRA
jgi:hypothetical protein